MYLLPTIELVERLKRAIDGRRAIEIGSGNGVLAEALGIQGTDNFMQEMPKYKALYAAQGQPTIKYGKNVENLDALAAIKKYKPEVVVAAWVTHRFSFLRPQAGGNEIGVDEEKVIDSGAEYVFVGNKSVHSGKKIWERKYQYIEYPDYIFSRAQGSQDFLASWK